MADNLNQYENRLRTLMTIAREGGRTSAETEKFSVDRHVFVQVVSSVPDYKYTTTVTAADANDPNTAAPTAARVWDLKGYMTLSGYMEFTGGTSPTASLELWAYDTTAKKWFLAGAASGVSDLTEFIFENKARHRVVYVRVASISGSPTSIDIRMSAE